MGKRYFSVMICLGWVWMSMQLSSCSLINPPVITPCYGHMDSIGLKTIYSSQGTASHNFSCFWVYVDNQPVGAFAFPCTFPAIATSGVHNITIYPGVTANGTGATREKYPFVTFYDSNQAITQGGITKYAFTAKYNTAVTYFHWMEDFDGPGLTITDFGPNDDTMHKTNSPNVFEGLHSGEVILDSNASYNHMIYTGVSDTFYLPHNGSPVFLEMNYNCNATFGVLVYYGAYPGISSAISEGIYAYVNPVTGWSKMYIDLTGALSNRSGPFCIGFTMTRPYGTAHAYLMLDNIKLLQFKGA